MRRQVLIIVVLLAAIAVWRLGHGGAAVALLLLVLCLQMSSYVRHLRPSGSSVMRRRSRPG